MKLIQACACLFVCAVAILLGACGAPQTQTEKTPCETHTYGEWTVTTPATCKTLGEEARTCPD